MQNKRKSSFFITLLIFLSAVAVRASDEDAQKIMSSRCILHGFHRALFDTQTANRFPADLPDLVRHVCAHVETVAAAFTRPIDIKIRKVLSLPYAVQTLMFNVVALPGYDSHVITRKVMIHDQIDKAMKAGCTQFVILGSGFDPGGVLWARDHGEGKTFFALDLFSNQKVMTDALRSYPGLNMDVCDIHDASGRATRFGNNYYSIVHDLEHGMTFERLESFGFKKNKRTFLLMEGLTVYLEQQTVSKVLGDFKLWSAMGSLALMGFTQKTISQQQVEAHRQAGEPYKFTIPLSRIPAYLDEQGWYMVGKYTSPSAIALNVGGWFYSYYYGWWLSRNLDAMGIDHTTVEPYFLIEKSNQQNRDGMPQELYGNEVV